MMQEMYEWYMDNLFPEHRRQAIKHAEKDGRDRKKRLAKGGAQRQASVDITDRERLDYMSRVMSQPWGHSGNKSGLTKWERIGAPLTASVVDWALIINPYTPPRMKWQSVQRQYDRYYEMSN
jgi:hypothetical protein